MRAPPCWCHLSPTNWIATRISIYPLYPQQLFRTLFPFETLPELRETAQPASDPKHPASLSEPAPSCCSLKIFSHYFDHSFLSVRTTKRTVGRTRPFPPCSLLLLQSANPKRSRFEDQLRTSMELSQCHCEFRTLFLSLQTLAPSVSLSRKRKGKKRWGESTRVCAISGAHSAVLRGEIDTNAACETELRACFRSCVLSRECVFGLSSAGAGARGGNCDWVCVCVFCVVPFWEQLKMKEGKLNSVLVWLVPVWLLDFSFGAWFFYSSLFVWLPWFFLVSLGSLSRIRLCLDRELWGGKRVWNILCDEVLFLMLDLYRSFENSIGYLLGTFPPAQIGEFETTNLEVEFLISLLASLSLSPSLLQTPTILVKHRKSG